MLLLRVIYAYMISKLTDSTTSTVYLCDERRSIHKQPIFSARSPLPLSEER
jgi:hypothetical protein